MNSKIIIQLLHKKQFIIKNYVGCFFSISLNICDELRYRDVEFFNLKQDIFYFEKIQITNDCEKSYIKENIYLTR